MDDHSNEMTNAQHEKGRLDPDKIEAEILANERTFLAWVRTSIAVMSLGFVIARFSFGCARCLPTLVQPSAYAIPAFPKRWENA